MIHNTSSLGFWIKNCILAFHLGLQVFAITEVLCSCEPMLISQYGSIFPMKYFKNLKKYHLHIQIKYLLVVPFTLGHLRLDADTKTILKTPACDFHGTVDPKKN